MDILDLGVLTHPDLQAVRRIHAFIDFATSRLRALRPLFEGASP